MNRERALYSLWIAAILTLFCLHFPHLLADFPNNSPWMDYSKYTDEGWYANAAIRHHLTGHWFLRGDFNPAVALPIWPLLLACVFRFTGVSLAATRSLILGVFGIDLLLAYRVVRTQARPWVALLAVSLLVSSPFLWAFSRLALLEPLLVCFLLLSWLLALRLRSTPSGRTATLIAVGLSLFLLILAKTTALFLLPSTLFLIVYGCGFRLGASLRALVIATASAALPWCAWYLLLIRPHYRVDYRYFFEANTWPQPTTFGGWLAAFWYALHGTLWISPLLCITALVLLVLVLFLFPPTTAPASRLAGQPIMVASLLTAGGYIFFAGWHNNPQPRYYEAVIYPLAFILVLTPMALLRRRGLLVRSSAAAAIALLSAVCLHGAFQIAGYLRHPQYTWVDAARGITRVIYQHPDSPRLLLSVSGDQISLLTHLPAICDDYGTWDLPYRIHYYRPGWFATWNDIDSGTLADLQTLYSLERVAAFSAFDDPDRNLLVLYRLHPLPPRQQTYSVREEESDNSGK